MVLVSLFSLAVLAHSVTSKPLLSKRFEYAVKDRHLPSKKWMNVGDAPGHQLLDLHIGLAMPRWDDLVKELYEVSDPEHPKYGQHLSADRVDELSKPHDEALDSVHEWLASHGLEKESIKHSNAKDWIRISIPVSQAEQLLDTKYSVFKHEDGTEVIRTPEWSLPKDLHEYVMTIQPTNSFLRANTRRRTFKPILAAGEILGEAGDSKAYQRIVSQSSSTNAPVNGTDSALPCQPEAINPTCLRALYKTDKYMPKALDKNTIAIANYLNETVMLDDLQKFLRAQRAEASDAKISFTFVNNGQNFQTNLTSEQLGKQLNAEGNLDGQTVVAMTYPMKARAYNTGGEPPFKPDAFTKSNTNEPYLEWLEYMLNKETDLPWTVTTSYGDDEQTVPKDYAVRVCQDMAKLGARGVTLLYASGDNGVGGDGACQANDGKDTPTFLPSFPVTCPFVTAVGGTKDVAPEVAAFDPRNNFASGGGFSYYFDQPDYQKDAVADYLASVGKNYTGMFNPKGRAYPDVAAQGQNYQVVWNGRNIMLDGTSASTPTMASVIALLNDYLISNGKPSMGFINPWLYKNGKAGFNDITSGSAKGCDVDGFQAVKGWDAVTGWGTPVCLLYP
jgi:tripeptidyl-peptidase-1